MNFYKLISVLILMQISFHSTAQSFEVNLWKNEIPNSISNLDYQEIKVVEDSVLVKVSQVSVPTITVFRPKVSNGTAIIICPGGGYAHLSINKEGYKVAEWLNSLGITAIVLIYRLPSDAISKNKSIAPLQDAQEAMRYVRRNAKNWNINEDKIGIMGFSAGGHLASTLATKYDEIVYNATDSVTAKPNFTILIYPVISMDEAITHKGSKLNLLGKNPSENLIQKFSNEKYTSENMATTFIVHASDDKSVPVENSINYYVSLKNKKVKTELHIYENGGHGFGLNKKWTSACQDWLIANKFL